MKGVRLAVPIVLWSGTVPGAEHLRTAICIFEPQARRHNIFDNIHQLKAQYHKQFAKPAGQFGSIQTEYRAGFADQHHSVAPATTSSHCA